MTPVPESDTNSNPPAYATGRHVTLILTSQAVVTCAHGGQVLLLPRQGVVLIQGAPVMCVPDLNGAPIVGCAQPPTPATKPCTTVVVTLPGSWSLKVIVDLFGIAWLMRRPVRYQLAAPPAGDGTTAPVRGQTPHHAGREA